MEVTASFNRCQIAVFIFLAKLSLSNAIDNNAVSWTKLKLIKSTDVIDQSIVTGAFYGTNSSIKCVFKCKHQAVMSFYYMNDSATCYCNGQNDNTIVEDDGGNIVYGNIVMPGTEAECQDLYNDGFRTDSEYTTSTGEKILCNLMNLGWIVFQRRVDGSVDFHRNWTEYVAGFGDAKGEFWLGLEELHQSTQSGCELHVYLEAEPDNPDQAKGYARYSNFSVGAAVSNYTLHVDGFSGNVGDSLSFNNGCPFGTYDADHDVLANYNCALVKMSGWWHNGTDAYCYNANLNRIYKGGEHEDSIGVRWNQPWGFHYSLLRTEMAFRC